MIAKTPDPPYFAVIFSSVLKKPNEEYERTSKRMIELAKLQEGFLDYESSREKLGITVSYWRDLDSIKKWKLNAEHILAMEKGKSEWYAKYKVRIAKVERDYSFENIGKF